MDFKSNISEIEYLVTGEGAYDYQSGFGKGAGLLISQFYHDVKNIFLICGKISESSISFLPENVIPFSILDYYENEQESILNYQEGIDNICQEIIKLIDF